MEFAFEAWRRSPRMLALDLAVRTAFRSKEAKFYQALAANQSRIGTVGLNLHAYIVAAVWRVMFCKAPTFVVVGSEAQGRMFFQAAERLISNSPGVRDRVWIGKEHSGLTLANTRTLRAVAILPPGVAGRIPDQSMVMFPNLDAAEGRYLKFAAELEQEGRILLAVNAPESRLPA